jgi:23S rRNA pseudouridine1911/1915/1917 synthase
VRAAFKRLDATTTGVVLFSKTRNAAVGLDAAFAGRHVEKTYLALCETRQCVVPDRIDAALDVSGRGRRGRVRPSPDGRAAATRVQVRERFPACALIEAKPVTGRKHQVRAHLADAGLPILGDTRYGGPAQLGGRAIPRPMLHASQLRLPHPVSGEPLSIVAPLPEDFEDLLVWLRRRAGLQRRQGGDGSDPSRRRRPRVPPGSER